jgi:hypothetical protein
MAKSADAADLKSVALRWVWGFKSPSGHHISRIASIVCANPLRNTFRVAFFKALTAPNFVPTCLILGSGEYLIDCFCLRMHVALGDGDCAVTSNFSSSEYVAHRCLS